MYLKYMKGATIHRTGFKTPITIFDKQKQAVLASVN